MPKNTKRNWPTKASVQRLFTANMAPITSSTGFLTKRTARGRKHSTSSKPSATPPAKKGSGSWLRNRLPVLKIFRRLQTRLNQQGLEPEFLCRLHIVGQVIDKERFFCL